MIAQFNINEKTNEIILSIYNDNVMIKQLHCCISYFCEQLPNMIKELTQSFDIIENPQETFLNKKQNNKNIIISILFDKNKHITTYRILKSFISGYMITSNCYNNI